MNDSLRLMGVFAHPDDESLGMGGVLAKYAAEGVETFVVTATRGERGRYFDNEDRPDDEAVGRVREAELRAAARELGAREVRLLDYVDGDLDRAEPSAAIGRIVGHLREVRPHVVVTFDPYGAYGHPDHIAICQFTTAAVVAAADPAYRREGAPDAAREPDAPHRVDKLYYMAWGPETWAAYQAAFKTLISRVDGVERRASPWPEWSITTRIDTRDHWETVWRAVQCHETQMAVYERLGDLTPEHHEGLWGSQSFYRAFSTVNGGRATETDLFAGLR